MGSSRAQGPALGGGPSKREEPVRATRNKPGTRLACSAQWHPGARSPAASTPSPDHGGAWPGGKLLPLAGAPSPISPPNTASADRAEPCCSGNLRPGAPTCRDPPPAPAQAWVLGTLPAFSPQPRWGQLSVGARACPDTAICLGGQNDAEVGEFWTPSLWQISGGFLLHKDLRSPSAHDNNAN